MESRRFVTYLWNDPRINVSVRGELVPQSFRTCKHGLTRRLGELRV